MDSVGELKNGCFVQNVFDVDLYSNSFCFLSEFLQFHLSFMNDFIVSNKNIKNFDIIHEKQNHFCFTLRCFYFVHFTFIYLLSTKIEMCVHITPLYLKIFKE